MNGVCRTPPSPPPLSYLRNLPAGHALPKRLREGDAGRSARNSSSPLTRLSLARNSSAPPAAAETARPLFLSLIQKFTYFAAYKNAMRNHFILLSLLLILPSAALNSQSAYQHISSKNIYDFLDELASEKLISLNSAIKPYTRTYIFQKLSEANDSSVHLTKRQLSELEYYLDYYTFGNKPNFVPLKARLNLFKKGAHSATSLNHLGYFYSDSIFNFSIRPILGLEYFSNASGSFRHTYGGLEAFAGITKYLSFYASLRDNTVDPILARPGYFTNESVGIYKGSITGAADYSEMRGGILLSWSFLEVGFIKDHITWGNNYNGAIIQSGLTPSIPMLKLHISPAKWFDFNYYHAWLTSDVVDSSLTYLLPDGSHRDTFKNKYMAANMFTIIPVKGLNLSFGNSIIYSDQNVNLAYLIPVFFYKSVDHTLTSNKIVNQNSQMFFDISARLIKHTHLFFTLFVDEFSTRRISNPDIHNLYSYKLGGRISNWPVQNVSVTGEFYRSVPGVYQHYVPTLTYETNSYNMGYRLRSNAEEKYFSIDWKPLPRLIAKYSYDNSRHGNDYQYVSGLTVDSYPILKDNSWTSVTHSLLCSYEFLTNCYVSLEYRMSNTKGYAADGQTAQYYLNRFTPELFQGKKNTVMVRINFGF